MNKIEALHFKSRVCEDKCEREAPASPGCLLNLLQGELEGLRASRARLRTQGKSFADTKECCTECLKWGFHGVFCTVSLGFTQFNPLKKNLRITR